MADSQDPRNQAGALATQPAQLPLGELALIGTMGTQANPGALIRLPGGGIRKVAIGDRLRGRQIDAIDAGRVLLSRNGQQTVLEMPAG